MQTVCSAYSASVSPAVDEVAAGGVKTIEDGAIEPLVSGLSEEPVPTLEPSAKGSTWKPFEALRVQPKVEAPSVDASTWEHGAAAVIVGEAWADELSA